MYVSWDSKPIAENHELVIIIKYMFTPAVIQCFNNFPQFLSKAALYNAEACLGVPPQW